MIIGEHILRIVDRLVFGWFKKMTIKTPQNKKREVFSMGKRSSNHRHIQDIKRVTSIDPNLIKKAIEEVYHERSCHVIPGNGSEWVVQVTGKGIANHYVNRTDAIKNARVLCEKNDFDLVIHGRDGRIIDSKRHGIRMKPKLK